MKLRSGYAYELEPGKDPFKSTNEDWDVVVQSPSGDETFVGFRRIDDHRCAVFRCSDGAYRAILDIGLDS